MRRKIIKLPYLQDLLPKIVIFWVLCYFLQFYSNSEYLKRFHSRVRNLAHAKIQGKIKDLSKIKFFEEFTFDFFERTKGRAQV